MRARGFSDYDELWRWSVEDLEGFWGALWDWFEIDAPYERVLGSREMPGAEWFPGAELNYAEQLFRGARPGETAIVHASESEPLAELTWDELADQVARCAAGLRRLGVGARRPRGGLHAERARDGGGVPRLREHRRGLVELRARVRHADGRRPLQADRAEGPDRHRGLPLRRARTSTVASGWPRSWPRSRRSSTRCWCRAAGTSCSPSRPSSSFERLPFDHPLWVLYSSGTTGLPKAIVQGQGGILLEHLKKARLHSDLGPGDRFFWFTTTGWMMWNFLVGGLLSGAAIVLYDGQPDPERLWQFAAEADVTSFGTSAGFIAASMKAGVVPPHPPRAAEHRLDRLAAAARGLRVDLRAVPGRLALLDERRHRPVHGVRRRVPDPPGVRRASCRRAASARRSRPGARTAGRS